MTESVVPLWRKCENAWAAYLAAADHLVTRLADAYGRDGEFKAPLMQMGAEYFRAPDISAMKAGVTEYWEVKQRSAAMVNRVTGEAEYWVSYEAFQDYYAIARKSGATVWMILRDSEIWSTTQKWLQADIVSLFTKGYQGIRHDAGGGEISAWIWPSSAMMLVDGPEVEDAGTEVPLLVRVGEMPPVKDEILQMIERDLRRPRPGPGPVEVGAENVAGVVDLLRENSRIGLETLRRSLGIPNSPRYSVMRVGLKGQDLSEVLGLVRYGIRVFLITETEPKFEVSDQWIDAYKASRLLEWALVPGAEKLACWVVDGAIEDNVRDLISRAPADQPFNYRQYMIVHSSHLGHVFVRAGAGTGKTETMAERIVFLLATSSLHVDPRDESAVFQLRLDEIVLVTFTREAAREMRSRIATTLMLRQRLCDKCVLPTIAWLMELSNTEIETIHTYSKKLIQREGSHVGLGPGFAVGELTMEFRRELKTALSPRLDAIINSGNAQQVPAAYQFEKFVESLWDKLSGNGLSPLAVGHPGARSKVVWGSPPDGLVGQVADAVREVVEETAKTFSKVCERNQTIPVSELVATAARAVSAAGPLINRAPRYLFVDEFQDTDSEQIQMVLSICSSANSNLFAVGDVKQGIYRFRGAAGNAFDQLTALAGARNLTLRSYTLTRNFRSGTTLLDSLHPFFIEWGNAKYLEYALHDRLEATRGAGKSKNVTLTSVPRRNVDDYVVTKVKTWLREFPRDDEKIAVLCRANYEAHQFVKALRAEGVSCEVRTGGDFYRSDAVRELRVLLEAMLNPSDDAALLELCTTRWFVGLSTMTRPAELGDNPISLTESEQRAWSQQLPAITTWAERLASVTNAGRFDRTDLDIVRDRVASLARLLQIKPVLGWLMDCNAWMQPRNSLLPGEDPNDPVERLRYGRCFDHLITLLDESFSNAPISPYRLLEWLRLKIATDRTEDEPEPTENSGTRVTVLTVHKAKGLQYDCVLIPGTANRFVTARGRAEEFAFVGVEGSARVLWKWNVGSPLTNVRPSDNGLWAQEDVERVREEARLLYVAMTRAREELDIVVATAGQAGSLPNSWADLLAMGGS